MASEMKADDEERGFEMTLALTTDGKVRMKFGTYSRAGRFLTEDEVMEVARALYLQAQYATRNK